MTTTSTGTVSLTATILKGTSETSSFTKEFTVSVRTAEEVPMISDIIVSPSIVNVSKGTCQNFSATVIGTKLEETDKNVYWSVKDGTKAETFMNANGKLTVAADERAKTLIVKATSMVDNTKYGTATVNLTAKSGEGIFIRNTSYETIADALIASEEKTSLIIIHDFKYGIPLGFSSTYTISENTHIMIEGRGSFE